MQNQPTWHIYKITCNVTQKSYIGLTVNGVRRRWSDHVSMAHDTKRTSVSIFHRAIRKYGRDQFDVDILCTAKTLSEASAVEIALIAKHGTMAPRGYNLSGGGAGTPGIRRKHSDDTREKISAAHMGKVFSQETRRLMSAAKKGIPLSAEHRQKLSEARQGKTISQEQRDKQSKTTTGKKVPLRTIALLQTNALIGGKPHPSSGYRGVVKDGNKWSARIGINGKKVHIGNFPTKELAAAAYQDAAKKRIQQLIDSHLEHRAIG